jgi:hypothetical protein
MNCCRGSSFSREVKALPCCASRGGGGGGSREGGRGSSLGNERESSRGGVAVEVLGVPAGLVDVDAAVVEVLLALLLLLPCTRDRMSETATHCRTGYLIFPVNECNGKDNSIAFALSR